MKVAWLCHLNNKLISNKLGVNDSLEFAPWIFRFAEIFEKFNEVDIHIVSPHTKILHQTTFRMGNIYFHFFPFKIPIVPKRVTNFFHYYSDFIFIKEAVKRIIYKIDPDLIHLFGTENAYFTSSIFQFKDKYPVLITVQGFINNITANDYQVRKRKKNEIKIIKAFNNFGVRDESMKTFLRSINTNVKFFDHEIAPYIPKVKPNEHDEAIFDLIFFARVSKDKGIEDLIRAVSIIKKEKHDITLCIIGPSLVPYLKYLQNIVINLGLEQNITFKGQLSSIDNVHKLAIKSRLMVLPTYSDTIPGTIIESMFMGIPCISYAVGGIPSLNEQVQIIRLVERGDVEGLVKEIVFLLTHQDKAREISKLAYKYVSARWNDNLIYRTILNAYDMILK